MDRVGHLRRGLRVCGGVDGGLALRRAAGVDGLGLEHSALLFVRTKRVACSSVALRGLPSLSVPGWYVASTSFSAMWTFSAKAVHSEKNFHCMLPSRNAVVCTVNVPLAARHGLPRNSH